MTTSFRVGDIEIHRVVEEEEARFNAFTFFPTLTKELFEEHRHWLEPVAIDPQTNNVRLCFQSYLIRTPHHTILIDTCLGNHKDLPNYPFWRNQTRETWQRNLAATGATVDQIDYVMCTHLHVDHVGWNTKLENGRWVPTFPKARYLFSETDFNQALADDKVTANPVFRESVLPVMEARRAELVTGDHSVSDHVRLQPAPGHTPGHFAVELGKRETRAVVTGDLIHSPLQARYPELSLRVDFDREQAAATRRAFLACHCEKQTLVCTSHFPSPSVGRFKAWDEGYRFEPASG